MSANAGSAKDDVTHRFVIAGLSIDELDSKIWNSSHEQFLVETARSLASLHSGIQVEKILRLAGVYIQFSCSDNTNITTD